MNCFECAKVNDTVAAVAVCQHCGVGLCLDHLIEANDFTLAGTRYACPHQIPRARPLPRVPDDIATAASRGTAASIS